MTYFVIIREKNVDLFNLHFVYNQSQSNFNCFLRFLPNKCSAFVIYCITFLFKPFAFINSIA